MLSPAELARLGDALAAHDGSPYAVAAIKLLVFTGARLGEVLGLRLGVDRFRARRSAAARQQNRRRRRCICRRRRSEFWRSCRGLTATPM